MARALTIQRTIIPAHERKQYMARLRERQAYYARANCSLRIFEEAALPGAFIEFTEADDPHTLAAAHVGAPGRVLDPARVYQQVEIP